MSIIDRLVDNITAPHDDSNRDNGQRSAPTTEPDAATQVPETSEVETTDEERERRTPRPDSPGHHGPVGVRGMRIRRLRLRSVAKIASMFFVLGFLTIIGTMVVVWNAALAIGFVDSFEETVTSALGLDERFTMVGQDLFEVVLMGVGLLMVLGWVLTLLLALVYNVACSLFGGLAVETGPLRRRRRVFSWRHRGFITIRD